MTYAKLKLAMGIAAAMLIVSGATTIALSQIDNNIKLTPQEIFKKAQDTYASLSSYSDQGTTVATINGMTLTTTFTIKLARPDLYRIEWSEPVNFGYSNKGTVWSAGNGNFMIMGDAPVSNESSMESALSSATGVSGSAAATIPGTFFNMNWGSQLKGPLTNEKRQADGKVGDVDCYVFTKESKGRTSTLWIGKGDFLIHQVQTVTSPEALNSALAAAAKINHGAPQSLATTTGVTSTETHDHIVINQKYSPADFQVQ